MASRAIDVSHLPQSSISSHAPLWWGQVLMAAIEGTMFLILIAMYFYIRLNVDMWPPPGDQLPHVLLPTVALISLLLSCVGSYWASEGAKTGERSKMLVGLAVNLLFALGYLGLRAYEWANFNFGWSTDVFASIIWALLFLHTFDAAADLIFTAVLIMILLSGRWGIKERLGVHVDSVIWYFLAGIWIPMYVVIYWGPRLVGAP